MAKEVLIIGAGPAGLTAAYELQKNQTEYHVTVIEASDAVGGIARNVYYKGNCMDMGGHRFFSKEKRVNDWWDEIMEMQNRKRISGILFENRFFDYPISIKAKMIRNLGLKTSLQVGFSYLHTLIRKLPETNLENFYINRFGRKLYELFFENYTEKLWGRHPSGIDASWGKQRVRGLSIRTMLRDMVAGFGRKNAGSEMDPNESFRYPAHGPGELWEKVADIFCRNGGTLITNAEVTRLHRDASGKLTGLSYQKDGASVTLSGDVIISTMPIKDLVAGMDEVPEETRTIAKGLPYRDYRMVGVLVKREGLKREIPDCWIYVQNREVKLGRIQIFNNWSEQMACDPDHTVWLGLEYFMQEGDMDWNASDEAFAAMAVEELLKLDFIMDSQQVLDTHVECMKKAYPAYFDTYNRFDTLREFLDSIPNLYCIGRNGQHRYNNMDHSMCTAFEAVDAIMTDVSSKEAIWNVNTELKYNESL